MDKVFGFEAYKDYYSKDDADTFIELVYKMCKDVIAPANGDCDEIGNKFVDGKVITPEATKKAYHTIVDAGLGPQFGDREAEGRMPMVLGSALGEMIINASPAISTLYGYQWAMVRLLQVCLPELKERFLPKMFAGEWGGTMCITEAGAGSDVGNASTKAYPTDTPGSTKSKAARCSLLR